MQDQIFEYIRRRKGGKTIRVGVILGKKVDDAVLIGWSKCNQSAQHGDIFNAAKGVQIALDRACGNANVPAVPKCVERQVRAFAARCCRYFRDAYKIEIPA